MRCKVNIQDKQKLKLEKGTRMLIRKSCIATLTNEGYDDYAEVNVTLVDDDEIRSINLTFRGLDASTDVLSFPMGENGVYDRNPETGAEILGDIVISMDHAIYQSSLYGHSLEREIAFLTAHSMLHLLGYNHENGGVEREIMREKEELVLKNLGLAINKA